MESSQSPLAGLYRPTQLAALYYGPGSVIAHLASCLPSSSSRAYIITGRSLANKTPLVKQVEQALGSAHAGTFSEIGQHAPVADIDAATDKLLADEHVDTIISLGGGSPIDSAKLVVHRVHERSPARGWLTHIAIPTTLSAAECSGAAGYTTSSGLKKSVAAPQLVPQIVLYDASFVDPHTPARLFLSTGLRALDHALETLYHPTATELTRVIALAATRDLFTYLPRYHSSSSSSAQDITKLQLAAFSSLGFLGLNLKGGLGLSHALGYALGSPYGIPHGITSCLTLGKVLRLKARQDAQTAALIARAASAVGLDVVDGMSDEEVATKVGGRVEELVRDLGLETDLTHYEVEKGQVVVIAENATGQKEGEGFDAVKGLVGTLW